MMHSLHTRTTQIIVLLIASVVVLAPFAWGQAATQGQWSTISGQLMTINPVHTALLRNGKILVVAGSGNCPPSQSGCPSGAPYGASNSSGAGIYDPVAGTFTQLSIAWDMFCSSMVVLADGRVLINGGTLAYDPFKGYQKTSIFDPSNNTFTDVQNMAHGRWYPTSTVLGDGRVMTFSGDNESNGGTNLAVEFYTVGTGWSQEYNASWTPPLYPRMHLLPNGKVVSSGPQVGTHIFNPANTTWTLNIAFSNYGHTRTYGSSVLLPLTPANGYDPRIMILGGNSPATATTEFIDMGAATPKWTYGPSMSQARIEMNAVLLPNGRVLALGGSVNDEDTTTKSLNADIFNTEIADYTKVVRSSAGADAYARLYHSVALLLPDATVWFAGGNPTRGSYEQHMEIYKPTYLFNSDGSAATRPTISSVPSTITWNGSFSVSTPDAANISSVVLMRPGSPTHAFDQDQRMVGLSFTAGSGTLNVTGPPNSNIAPAGYYMLFIFNTSGVPAVAKFVQLTTSGSAPAPGVSSISPTSGTTAGGTPVTITGTNFVSGATVTIGGVAATGVTVASSTSITATTPAHAAGAVNVVVTNPDTQTGTLTNGYTYVSTAPGVTSVSPTSGTTLGGTPVTITGTNFVSGATVTFGGTAATGVTFVSSTSITATTPAHAAGAVNVVVTNPNTQTGTLTNGYTYTSTAPGVSSISPTSGTTAGGTPVTITGTNFVSGATVTFGGTAATGVTVANSTSITATTPAHAAGAVNVVVTNPNTQTGTLTNGYTYTTSGGGGGTIAFVQVNAAVPQTASASVATSYPLAQTAGNLNIVAVGWNDTTSTVSSVTDTRGNTYTLAIGPTTGSGLRQSIYYAKGIAAGNNTVTVTFNQAAAYVDVRVLEYSGMDTSSPLDVTAGAAGNSNSASSGGATTTAANELIFGAGMTAGRYTGAGTGFGSRIITNPDGDIAEDKAVSATGSNSAAAPMSTSTSWVMQMATFKASGQGGSAPAPGVSSISPTSGTTAGGTPVTITGTNFVSGATVTIGGTAATGVSVGSSTSITATTPAHSAGAVNVVVTNPDTQTGTLNSGYTYTSTAPSVSSISPTSGTTAGGTPVTITGTNFVSGATVTIGGSAATGVSVGSSTSITATTPAHAAGAVNVVVTNPDTQTGTLNNGYTYTSTAPTVGSISPTSGTTAGGTPVTITGTNFVSGATVTIGGSAATGVSVGSSTSITATTPAHAAGAVNVVVTNPDTQTGTLNNGYTYTTSGGIGTIAFVQVNAATPQSASASVATSYPLAQTAGNLNIVAVGWNDTTSTVSSVTDTRGNTYTLAIGPTSGTGLRQSIYYARNIAAGSNTVTVTFNQAATYVDVRVLEYSGLDTSSPLDVTAGAAGSSNSASSPAVNTNAAIELIFGAGMTAGRFTGPGTGFGSRIITNPDGDIAEDKVVTSTGSNSAVAPMSTSTSWVMQVATFKASGQ